MVACRCCVVPVPVSKRETSIDGIGPTQILDINQWGPLASAGMNTGITNERAIILIAHVHVLVVSVVAAFAPFQFQDTLVKERGYTPEAPAGFIPAFKTGLTPQAGTYMAGLLM
jgi:hypothetical protein